MKLDITRAWKDESYRQNLDEEQLSTLPANPAGQMELSDAELAAVCGSDGGGGDPAYPTIRSVSRVRASISRPRAVAVSSSSASSVSVIEEHIHSFALTCDISVFSINAALISVLNIASPIAQICVNND